MKRIAAISMAGLMAVACTTYDPATGRTTRNNTGSGALLGAVLGGALGAAAGGDDRRNVLIGAGIGALAGAGVGKYMDQQQRILEQQLSGTGVGVQREGDFIRLIMPSDITFSTASAQIEGNFYPVLDDVSAVLNEYPKTLIDITGHADKRGDAGYNQQLSLQRSTSVGNYLVSRSVLQGRIAVYGAGEDQPKCFQDTDQCYATNRRVEIVLRPFTEGS